MVELLLEKLRDRLVERFGEDAVSDDIRVTVVTLTEWVILAPQSAGFDRIGGTTLGNRRSFDPLPNAGTSGEESTDMGLAYSRYGGNAILR